MNVLLRGHCWDSWLWWLIEESPLIQLSKKLFNIVPLENCSAFDFFLSWLKQPSWGSIMNRKTFLCVRGVCSTSSTTVGIYLSGFFLNFFCHVTCLVILLFTRVVACSFKLALLCCECLRHATSRTCQSSIVIHSRCDLKKCKLKSK